MSMFLIIEDEKNLGSTLQDYFSSQGHEVYWARHCEAARKFFQAHPPQVVLMDLGLPDGNGLDLAKEMRSYSKSFILFFLSAQSDPETRLQGLELGAEDFIGKPFQLRELTLRLDRALGQQKLRNQSPESYNFGRLAFLPRRFEMIDGQGHVTNLSQKECAVLEMLFEKMNQTVSRDDMIDTLWGPQSYPSERTIDNFIVKYRKWIESDPDCGLELSTVRGVGHRLTQKLTNQNH